MEKKRREGLRTWIEVNKSAIAHNFGVFKSLISKKTKLMAVVKSNAYGHGLIDFSREMEKLGADFLGVDSITEGLALRREGIKLPILVLGYTLPEMIVEAAEKDISLAISTFESLDYIKANQKNFVNPLKIHIKVDTGMHRQGFLADDLPKILGELKVESGKLKVEGLFTHFASAKNPSFKKDTEKQIVSFKKWILAFKEAGMKPIVHACATGGAMIFPEAQYDMVRVGMGLYGLWPDREVKEFLQDKITLRPAITWKSIITEVKTFSAGERIGYDLTETFEGDTKVAVVPVGYWHGLPRALSSIGRFIVNKKECRILGRVSMDMVCINISNVKEVKAGDEVTVIGNDSKFSSSMEGITKILGVSWYETTTRLNPLIKRIYL